jgi:hypothetical protein
MQCHSRSDRSVGYRLSSMARSLGQHAHRAISTPFQKGAPVRSPLVTSSFSARAADVAGYAYNPVPTGRRRTIMSRNTSRNAQT